MGKGKNKNKTPGTWKGLNVGNPKSVARPLLPDMDAYQKLNLLYRARAWLPSDSWADEQFIVLEDEDSEGYRRTRMVPRESQTLPVGYVVRNKLVMPSGFRECLPRNDGGCGRHMPGISIGSSGHCDECILEAFELPAAIGRERSEEARARWESRQADGLGNPVIWIVLSEVLEQLPASVVIALLRRLESLQGFVNPQAA